jgi:type VI secretion system protein ImpB
LDRQIEELKQSSVCDKVPLSYRLNRSAGTLTGVLPFVIGVLSDLSGKPGQPLPRLRDRRFVQLHARNFSNFMQAVKPRVSFEVPDVLNGQGLFPVELTFESMWDFTPDAIAHNSKMTPISHNVFTIRA